MISQYFVADLSAKVRWRMRFERNPLFITFQDKLAVRTYAREKGVATAALLHCTDAPDSIPFDDLPPNYMIKANHGCGWNIACIGSKLFSFGDGSRLVGPDGLVKASAEHEQCELTRSEVRSLCQQWLESRHLAKEWAYQHIAPRIIVEEMLVARHGGELHDCRLYTFNGNVRAINIGSAAYRRNHNNVFMRPDWTVIPLSRYAEALPPTLPRRPDSLPEMLDIARRLGEGVSFVRIDLYDTQGGVVLGEMTVYPQAGTRGTPSGCPALDTWLGEQWPMSIATRCAVIGLNMIDLPRDVVSAARRRLAVRVANPEHRAS